MQLDLYVWFVIDNFNRWMDVFYTVFLVCYFFVISTNKCRDVIYGFIAI